MASISSFKIKCESCGEPVPIRDPKLIGKKIDCPTCKYRFVVPKPPGADKTNGAAAKPGATAKSAAAAAAAAKAKGLIKKGADAKVDPKKAADKAPAGDEAAKTPTKGKKEADAAEDGKKGKGKEKKKREKTEGGLLQNKLVLGLGLAGVGLVLLVVALFVIMGSGGSTKKPGPHFGGGGVGEDDPDWLKSKRKQRKKAPSDDGGFAGPGRAASENFTNLLPGNTEHVAHVHVRNLKDSPAGEALFRRFGGLGNPQIMDKIGFLPAYVDEVLHGENYSTGWAFNAVHSTQAFDENRLITALGLQQPAGGPIKNQKYYEVTRNSLWLEEFGRLTITNRRPILTAGLQKERQPLYVHLHDDHTLIVADRVPMQEFLEAEGKFKFYDTIGDSDKASEKPMQPFPFGPPSFPPSKEEPKSDMPPDGETPDPNTPPAVTPPDNTPPGVVPPEQDISAIDEDSAFDGFVVAQAGPPPGIAPPGQTPPTPGAGKTPRFTSSPLGPRLYRTLKNKDLRNMMRQMETLPKESKTRIILSSATLMDKAQVKAKNPLLKNLLMWHVRSMWDITQVLEEKTPRIEVLGVSVRQREPNKFQLHNTLVCTDEETARGMRFELLKEASPEIAQFFQTVFGHKIEVIEDAPKKKKTVPGLFPPGIFPPGETEEAGNPEDEDMMPDNGEYYPGFMPGGQFGKKKEKKEEEINESQIQVKRTGSKLAFDLHLVLDDKAMGTFLAITDLVGTSLVSQLEVADMEEPLKLGKALADLGEKGLSEHGMGGGYFPRGAFQRQTAKRIAQEPLERVSWMAGLLPYLGRHRLYSNIHFNDSWKSPSNWLVSRTVIPEFIDPNYPAHLRSVNYPGLPFDVGATHFVGVAGVGPNAALYDKNDPAAAGKIGIFGHERETTMEDIRKGRGLSNTIAMIQIPPDSHTGMTPWMAGGGSTVRGVPETGSIKPFVGNHGSRGEGTYVIMADGSVRFLTKDVSDEVFKAMCTINGPTPGVSLDTVGERVVPVEPVTIPEKKAPKSKDGKGKPGKESEKEAEKDKDDKAVAPKISLPGDAPPQKDKEPAKEEPVPPEQPDQSSRLENGLHSGERVTQMRFEKSLREVRV